MAATASHAGAATYEEAAHLDDAYPPGSTEVCIQNLPRDAKNILPTRLEVRATIISRTADLTTGRGIVTWITHGSTAPGLTLTYTFKQRENGSGYYSRIDPASMAVSMPAVGPEGEKNVLESFRRRMPAGEEFAPFSQIEITDFPSYVVRKPGEPVSYCHKAKQK